MFAINNDIAPFLVLWAFLILVDDDSLSINHIVVDIGHLAVAHIVPLAVEPFSRGYIVFCINCNNVSFHNYYNGYKIF